MQSLMQDSEAKWMQRATTRVIMPILASISTRSTRQVVPKLTTFATQKNIPLTITEGIPDFSISMKASDTKELKPARRTMMRQIMRQMFWRRGKDLDAQRRTAAMKPERLRMPMTLVLEMRQLFLMKVPRLLKKAVERLAARPRRAICLSLSPCPSKITRKSDPQVQFMPTIAPQQTSVAIVNLCSLENPTTLSMKPFSECSSTFDQSSALILSLSLQSKIKVNAAEKHPTAAMMKFRSLIFQWICYVGRLCPSPFVIQVMPYKMQKLIPKTGRKSGMEAAYPFWLLGKSLRRPQGAVMMGMCAMATTEVIPKAIAQFCPAKYRPTAATPAAAVETATYLRQCL